MVQLAAEPVAEETLVLKDSGMGKGTVEQSIPATPVSSSNSSSSMGGDRIGW